MKIQVIHERLVGHRPVRVDGANYARAAVAVVLREGEEGAECIVIRRTQRLGDPWSGHMALPGGRQHAEDRDLFTTAARETREEVGIDLEEDGQLLGPLDELRAIGRGRPLDLVISPFVYGLTAPVTLVLDHREVHSALWVPLAFLRGPEARGTFRHTHQGLELEHQAFVYRGHTIWGLTYRILSGLLEVL